MANNKHIGNSYEREFSKRLSLWMTGDPNKDAAWRLIDSGSRFTNRKKQGKETARKGDIVATDLQYQPFFDMFFVDTKSLKQVDFNFLKGNKSNNLVCEWIKVCSDCPSNMHPLMPVKIRDRSSKDIMVIRHEGVAFNMKDFLKVDIGPAPLCFYIVPLEQFFELNKYTDFMFHNILSTPVEEKIS